MIIIIASLGLTSLREFSFSKAVHVSDANALTVSVVYEAAKNVLYKTQRYIMCRPMVAGTVIGRLSEEMKNRSSVLFCYGSKFCHALDFNSRDSH